MKPRTPASYPKIGEHRFHEYDATYAFGGIEVRSVAEDSKICACPNRGMALMVIAALEQAADEEQEHGSPPCP